MEMPAQSASSLEQLATDFSHKSNVGFFVEDGDLYFSAYDDTPISDEKAKQYAIEKYYHGTIPDVFDSRAFTDAKDDIQKEHIGGMGIQARTLDQTERILPGITDKLKTVDGKIVVLGNGLSTALFELAPDILKHTNPQIVLVDVFDYEELLGDLKKFKTLCDSNAIDVPDILNQHLVHCETIVNYKKKGMIKTVQYVVGKGKPSEEIKNADLAISVFGPSITTLAEQIDLLSPTGELWVTENPYPSKKEWNIIPIDSGKASIIKKTI